MSDLDDAREYLDKANRPGPADVALGHLISAIHLVIDRVEALEHHIHYTSPSIDQTGGIVIPDP